MLRILGRPTSINVRKVLWTAAEIGLEFVHEPQWATPAAPAASPAFRRLNPNGLVPVIEDEAGVLWESNTICRYLARRHGRGDLLPDEPAAQARVEMWMDWQATELNGAWRYVFMALGRRDPAYADTDEIVAGARRWNEVMSLLDAQLAETGAFVAGASFTLADIVVGLSVHRWRATPMERPQLSAVEAYVARLAAETRFSDFARPETP
ncbi:glutathione S-transferase family protein [Phenylobacterium sp.]|jgi:glutathione S-transferase|uniref:glutathione S-transferase family protein n=1 Tax=Phenylobacterium sp. TaxID=1871053 RepID=UPI002E2FB517|nr:glutathione S-transferase N-terminal domain-containing protein [Phenylobacterium sp.]HEX2561777.1 glutathione S-transferase N-terminal domain-containing protein [Phenylobacterium sp.]